MVFTKRALPNKSAFVFPALSIQSTTLRPPLNGGDILPNPSQSYLKVARGKVEIELQVVRIKDVVTMGDGVPQVVNKNGEEKGAKDGALRDSGGDRGP